MDRKKVLAALKKAPADGIKMVELADALDVPKKAQHQLRKLIQTLAKEGLVTKPSRVSYALAHIEPEPVAAAASEPAAPFAIGRIRVHPAGYGFVEREDRGDDVFVPAKYRGTALDGDRVQVYTWDGYKGTEGRVEAVLSRGRARLTGLVTAAGHHVYLEPDDPRIASTYGRVSLDELGSARVGDCVLAEITRYPSERDASIAARPVRVLGPPDDPRTEVAKIVACADIPEEFPPDVASAGARVPEELRPEDLADRIDLRDRMFLTIDPETARDFDDAICLEARPGGGHRVWVAVADVSHYVRPDDPIDREAQIRGVSVYFPDRAIPMLPHQLSSGICSLNPGVDRCAMVVRLDLDDEANLLERSFAAAVIRSHARLNYPDVAAALAGDFRGRVASYRKWEAELHAMDRLARLMRKRRTARGSLQLELPEAKVVLDEDDPLLVRDVVRAKGIESVRRAYELVEEYMLAANESVGAFFDERGLPTVWRVHPPPDEARVADLAAVLDSFGIYVDVAAARSPSGMKAVLEQLRGKKAERSLTFLALRSLSQACYTTDNVGHFGLASEQYLHFTSPIRRYPDVLVHRLLKHYLHREGHASGGGGAWRPPTVEQLEELAGACSGYERRAAEAEREVVDMYRAFVMRGEIGETFDGAVSGVTHFGVFIELDEPFVEGLTKLDAIGDDYWEYDPRTMRVSGRKTGAQLGLGDRVRVEVVNVSVARRQIDLRLLDGPQAGNRERRTRKDKEQRRERAARDKVHQASGRGRGRGKRKR